ncbi:MAG: hypothetical protein RR614_05455 [Eubacterium sp.]
MKKIILAALIVMLLFSGTALAAEKSYKAEEVAALQNFMEEGDSEGRKNGQKLRSDYNKEDPATYGGVFWQDSDGDGVYQARDILLTGNHFVGSLNVSGFTQLNSLNCSGATAFNPKGTLSIAFSDCGSLRAVNISHTGITNLDIQNVPNLKGLVLNDNYLETLTLQEAPSLMAMSLAENAFTQTALPVYNYTTEKQYQPQKILGTYQLGTGWTIGTTGSLEGLGAEGAQFTLCTEEGKSTGITDPSKADFSAYKGQKIYLKIEKSGYLTVLTNTVLITDGTFDYPVKPGTTPELDTPKTPEFGGKSPNLIKSPHTGVLSTGISAWISILLLALLIGGAYIYKRRIGY